MLDGIFEFLKYHKDLKGNIIALVPRYQFEVEIIHEKITIKETCQEMEFQYVIQFHY